MPEPPEEPHLPRPSLPPEQPGLQEACNAST